MNLLLSSFIIFVPALSSCVIHFSMNWKRIVSHSSRGNKTIMTKCCFQVLCGKCYSRLTDSTGSFGAWPFPALENGLILQRWDLGSLGRTGTTTLLYMIWYDLILFGNIVTCMQLGKTTQVTGRFSCPFCRGADGLERDDIEVAVEKNIVSLVPVAQHDSFLGVFCIVAMVWCSVSFKRRQLMWTYVSLMRKALESLELHTKDSSLSFGHVGPALCAFRR